MSKTLNIKYRILALLAVPAFFTGNLFAHKANENISGSLSLDFNTHFISYGADVWGAGEEFGNDILFNPSFGLTFDLGDGWSANIGTWWDVNNNAPATIGDSIQEIDVWAGIGYTTGAWSFSLTYQEWFYASDVERILDVGIAYEHALSPSITIHNRVEGNGGQETGTAVVLGISQPWEPSDSVSVSFPLNVGFFTDDYHGGDSGFGFASIGAQASVPLGFFDEGHGDWAWNFGATYYFTDDDVIPGNTDEQFVTFNTGISLGW